MTTPRGRAGRPGTDWHAHTHTHTQAHYTQTRRTERSRVHKRPCEGRNEGAAAEECATVLEVRRSSFDSACPVFVPRPSLLRPVRSCCSSIVARSSPSLFVQTKGGLSRTYLATDRSPPISHIYDDLSRTLGRQRRRAPHLRRDRTESSSVVASASQSQVVPRRYCTRLYLYICYWYWYEWSLCLRASVALFVRHRRRHPPSPEPRARVYQTRIIDRQSNHRVDHRYPL